MSGTERVTDRSSLTNRVTDDRMTRDEAGRWLRPCPFCGGEAKEHAAFASRSGVGVYVECGVCGAQSRTFWGDGAQDEAVGAWSRRAERTCRMEALLLGEFFTGRKHVTDTELSDEELEKVLLELRDDTRIRCSACNVLVLDGADVTYTQTDDGAWSVDAGMSRVNYCPSCGAKVVENA